MSVVKNVIEAGSNNTGAGNEPRTDHRRHPHPRRRVVPTYQLPSVPIAEASGPPEPSRPRPARRETTASRSPRRCSSPDILLPDRPLPGPVHRRHHDAVPAEPRGIAAAETDEPGTNPEPTGVAGLQPPARTYSTNVPWLVDDIRGGPPPSTSVAIRSPGREHPFVRLPHRGPAAKHIDFPDLPARVAEGTHVPRRHGSWRGWPPPGTGPSRPASAPSNLRRCR